jgi:hypothetical protein
MGTLLSNDVNARGARREPRPSCNLFRINLVVGAEPETSDHSNLLMACDFGPNGSNCSASFTRSI